MSSPTTDPFAYLTEPDPFAAPAPATPQPVVATEVSSPARPNRVRRRMRLVGSAPRVQLEPAVVIEDLSPLQAYDYARREEARQAGTPTDRMRTAAVLPGVANDEGQVPPFAYLWIDEATDRVLHTTDDFDGGSPAKVNAQVLSALLDGGYRLVMPDDAVASRLLRAVSSAARNPDPDKAEVAARVSRQLAVISRLSWSGFFIVLTDALARRFWMPLPYSPDDIRAWSLAFGISPGPMDHATVSELLLIAAEGQTSPRAKDAFYAERSAIRSAFFPGLRASVSAFQSVNRAEGAMSAMAVTDLSLLDRHVITGTVCRAQVLHGGARGFHASLSQPFKLRSGKEHSIITGRPGEDSANAVLISVEASGRDLVGAFEAQSKSSKPRRSAPAGTIAAAALAQGDALYVFEKPFSARPPSSTDDAPQGRWSASRRVDTVEPRWSIPVEVAMAGAPTRV